MNGFAPRTTKGMMKGDDSSRPVGSLLAFELPIRFSISSPHDRAAIPYPPPSRGGTDHGDDRNSRSHETDSRRRKDAVAAHDAPGARPGRLVEVLYRAARHEAVAQTRLSEWKVYPSLCRLWRRSRQHRHRADPQLGPGRALRPGQRLWSPRSRRARRLQGL